MNEAETKEQLISEQQYTQEQLDLFREMIANGVILGRKKSVTNPKMEKFIFTYSKNLAVFDAEQTLKLIDQAATFLKDLLDKKLSVLVVGTQMSAKDLVENFAKKYGFAYVIERWLGGTLTNLKVISQRVQYYLKLKSDLESGQLDKYTKKERIMISRNIDRMRKNFTGLENLNQLPAAVFLIDAAAHETALREARRLAIPIMALMNNDNNPEGVDYPIPANDNLRSSLIWIFARIEKWLETSKNSETLPEQG